MKRILTAVLAAVALAACGSSTSSTTSSAAAPSPSPSAAAAAAPVAGDPSVTIKVFAFGPKELTVKAGTAVTWHNEDQILHTVTSGPNRMASGLFDRQLDGPGSSASFTFATPGTYPYFCNRHPGMAGQIVVT